MADTRKEPLLRRLFLADLTGLDALEFNNQVPE